MKAYAIELPDETVEELKEFWKVGEHQMRDMLQQVVTLYIVQQGIEMTRKEKE